MRLFCILLLGFYWTMNFVITFQNRHANDDVLFNRGFFKLNLKVLVPIHSLIHPTFFKHMEIWVPKIESYLEGLMCEI